MFHTAGDLPDLHLNSPRGEHVNFHVIKNAAAEASLRASRKQELLTLLNKKDKEAESSLTREEILAKIAEM